MCNLNLLLFQHCEDAGQIQHFDSATATLNKEKPNLYRQFGLAAQSYSVPLLVHSY